MSLTQLGQNLWTSESLAVALVTFVVIALGIPTAHAAINCVVGPGVTQTATTVTGTDGNDTIDCGGANPGKRIVGLAGNDTITGTALATRLRAAAAMTPSREAVATTP